MSWYSMDPENGVTLHNTADEAEKAAQADMQYHRDCADNDFWHEDIEVLSWGELIRHGEVRCVERGPAPEGAPYDEYEDWQLVRLPVAEPAHDPLTCSCCRAAAATLDPESFERFEARRDRAEALLKEETKP